MKSTNEFSCYHYGDIIGWHEPTITEREVLIDKNGIMAAYFPDVPDDLKILTEYIISEGRKRAQSDIPHGNQAVKAKSIFFGALRTDGSLGRHRATLASVHQHESNDSLLTCVALLASLAVNFVTEQDERLKRLFIFDQERMVSMCDKRACISSYFTSGAINFDGILELHRDSASLPGVLNLIVYRKQGRGGHLLLPEYGHCIDAADYSIALLRVKDVLHGVTAFEGEFRDCITYYAVNGTE